MSLNNNQASVYAALGTSAEGLDDKIAAFIAAQAAMATATANATAAKSDLDAAWADYLARDAAFDSAMLVAPGGYTPPT